MHIFLHGGHNTYVQDNHVEYVRLLMNFLDQRRCI